jgi:hypothetical protein
VAMEHRADHERAGAEALRGVAVARLN